MLSLKVIFYSVLVYLFYKLNSHPIDSGFNYSEICIDSDDSINAKLGFTLFKKMPHFFLQLKNPKINNVQSTASWFGSYINWNPTPGFVVSPDPFATEGIIIPINFEISCHHIHNHQLERYHILAVGGFTDVGNCISWCGKVLSNYNNYSFDGF